MSTCVFIQLHSSAVCVTAVTTVYMFISMNWTDVTVRKNEGWNIEKNRQMWFIKLLPSSELKHLCLFFKFKFEFRFILFYQSNQLVPSALSVHTYVNRDAAAFHRLIMVSRWPQGVASCWFRFHMSKCIFVFLLRYKHHYFLRVHISLIRLIDILFLH